MKKMTLKYHKRYLTERVQKVLMYSRQNNVADVGNLMWPVTNTVPFDRTVTVYLNGLNNIKLLAIYGKYCYSKYNYSRAVYENNKNKSICEMG